MRLISDIGLLFLVCIATVRGRKCYTYDRPSDYNTCYYTYGYDYFYRYSYNTAYYYNLNPFPCCPNGYACTANFACISNGAVVGISLGCLVFVILLSALICLRCNGYLTKACVRPKKVGTVRITVKPQYTANATNARQSQQHVNIQFLTNGET